MIYVLARLCTDQLLSPDTFGTCHLVVAGGYDINNEENKQHFVELRRLIEDLGLTRLG